MPISLDSSEGVPVIRITGVTQPDEGDQLMALLRENPGAAVNLAELEHLHTALLQILLTVKCPVEAWPEDGFWRKCLEPNPSPLPLSGESF